MRFQSLEPLGPFGLVGLEPFVRFREGLGVEPTPMGPALDSAPYQAGSLQGLQMFRDGRERDPERRGELGHGELTVGESVKHRPPGGIPEGPKHSIQVRPSLNHMVEYIGQPRDCQPDG